MFSWSFKSLRAQLLFWLLVPLALFAALDAWITYRSAQQTANIVQERMLLGAARVIGEQVHLEEGVVQVMIPPSALELFVSPARDRVFYRISGPSGQLLSGYFDLALPPRALAAEEVVYFDAVQRDKPVRIVAFAQPVFAEPSAGPILIEVAQTLEGRDELAREVWLTAIGRQALLLLLVSVFLWLGLRRGMLPLLTLRDRVLRRAPGTLERLDEKPVPSELKPLVAAVNDYVARLDGHMSAHSRFIADASHQLRTPLTLLNTQVVYALRHSAQEERTEALHAIHASVTHSVRLVNQLLAFTRAEADTGQGHALVAVDAVATVHHVLETLAALAQQQRIDLGFESAHATALVHAVPHLLHEMLANLVDNALRYTPAGGAVTVRVLADLRAVTVQVQDDGPGIALADRARVFERFVRLHNDQSDGCGLGLSIVQEIAKSLKASIWLEDPAEGSGLVVSVRLGATSSTHLAAATNSVV